MWEAARSQDTAGNETAAEAIAAAEAAAAEILPLLRFSMISTMQPMRQRGFLNNIQQKPPHLMRL
jgi:hypothetical protein